MKLILRNLMRIFRRFRTAMILNILGLAVAFTAFMLLMMQWNYDRQFDRNDPNADRIFRIAIVAPHRRWLPSLCLAWR